MFGREKQECIHILITQPSIFLDSLPEVYATSRPLENIMKLSIGRKHTQIMSCPFQRRWTMLSTEKNKNILLIAGGTTILSMGSGTAKIERYLWQVLEL